uniref:ER membrane protein complex subunit 4 n=1 Tax=Scapholeberis mucronata TaxID=202097 RepID=A0A4Y7NL11_9CRUS|nr:EOG090X0GNX [Scapholeberis mucronata]
MMASSSGTSRNIAKKFKWSIDLSNRNKTTSELPSPPGYLPSTTSIVAETTKETDSSLLIKRSWDVALQPLKQVPMNLFMMYMVGSSISIFPIMMVGMMFVRPIRALFSVNQTFKMFEGTQAFGQVLVYILGQLVGIGLALYKCQSMGLLPTHSSDWLAFIEPQQRIEFSGGGQILI